MNENRNRKRSLKIQGMRSKLLKSNPKTKDKVLAKQDKISQYIHDIKNHHRI
jgi:hypothetical protein